MSNVVDFQTEALGRLRSRAEAAETAHAELLAHTREHAGAEAQVHTAVLLALEATSLEHFIHIITADWVDVLGLDCVAVALEAGAQGLRVSNAGLQFLESGGLAGLLPADEPVVLRSVAQGAEVFGPAAPLIRSEALIRLAPRAPLPTGILALGGRVEHAFDGVRAMPLLSFLGGVVERGLAGWMMRAP